MKKSVWKCSSSIAIKRLLQSNNLMMMKRHEPIPRQLYRIKLQKQSSSSPGYSERTNNNKLVNSHYFRFFVWLVPSLQWISSSDGHPFPNQLHLVVALASSVSRRTIILQEKSSLVAQLFYLFPGCLSIQPLRLLTGPLNGPISRIQKFILSGPRR